MPVSLKESNKIGLYGLVAANLALYYLLLRSTAIVTGDWLTLLRGLSLIVPAGVGTALTGVVAAQFSAQAKARIVFMRWRDPLPGSEAFTKYARMDPRVDVQALERLIGQLPTTPAEQNATWYRLYKTVDHEPAVIQAHRAFLFARDYSALVVILSLVLGVLGSIQLPSVRTRLAYVFALVLQFALASRAARTNGRRFVTTVLAIKAAQENG